MILGYGLGFEDPSFASFVQGLKHAMNRKGPSLSGRAKNEWPCYGRIENLYIDNGLEFLGDDIKAASRELQFNFVRCKPRQPWLKGALERFFGTLNTGLLHSLRGTTLSNVIERKDHEHLGEAVLTLGEFEALFDLWIRDEYHARLTKGLGFIRGFGGTPLETWAEKSKNFRTVPLPDPDVFLNLVGDVDHRTIQNEGITWDYIIYESPELSALRSHPQHRRRGEGGATKYEVVRNPFDLGTITVKDPYNKKTICVPATLAHRASLKRNPGRKKVKRALARYLHVEQSRRHRSAILLEPSPKSPAEFIGWDQPQWEPSSQAPPAIPDAHASTPARFGPADNEAEEDDLEELRGAKGWKVRYDD